MRSSSSQLRSFCQLPLTRRAQMVSQYQISRVVRRLFLYSYSKQNNNCLSSHFQKRHGRAFRDRQDPTAAFLRPTVTGIRSTTPALLCVRFLSLLGRSAARSGGFWAEIWDPAGGVGPRGAPSASAPAHRPVALDSVLYSGRHSGASFGRPSGRSAVRSDGLWAKIRDCACDARPFGAPQCLGPCPGPGGQG